MPLIDGANGFDLDAGRIDGHQEQSDAGLFTPFIGGANQGVHHVGFMRMRGPDFLTIDDVFVSL